MKIIKPDHLSLLYATFPRLPGFPAVDDALGLSLSLLAGFPLNHDASEALLPENVIWQRIQEALPADEILDQGLPKPRAEFLVYGACSAHVSGALMAPPPRCPLPASPLPGARPTAVLGMPSIPWVWAMPGCTGGYIPCPWWNTPDTWPPFPDRKFRLPA